VGTDALGPAGRGIGADSMGGHIGIDHEVSGVLTSLIQVLFFFGSKIRSRSKVSRKILENELQQLDRDKTVVSSPTEEQNTKV
jgi:hypothetical protein